MLHGLLSYAFLASFSYILSCFVILGFEQLPSLSVLLCLASVILLGSIWLRFAFKVALLAKVGFFLAMFLLSLCLQVYRAEQLLELRLPAELDSRIFFVEGKVLGLPENRQQVQVFDFEIHKSEMVWGDNHKSRKVRLSIYEALDTGLVKSGEYYRLLVKLRQPRGSLNFSGFDYERWMFTEGYHAKGYVRASSENKILRKEVNRLSKFRENLRDFISAGKSSQARAVLVALIVGDRSLLNVETREVLIKTGVAHLLAISGMHIGLLALSSFMLVFLVLKTLTFVFNFSVLRSLFIPASLPVMFNFNIALFISCGLACCYAVISGFALPAQRALIMLCCYSVAMMFFTRINYFLVWYIALFLVLLFQPYASTYAGFYLSFAAVWIIQWYLINNDSYDLASFKSKVFLFAKIQAVLLICLAPFSLNFFSNWFVKGLLANFFAVPLVSFFILPAAFVASVLWAFDVVHFSNWILFWLEQAVYWLLSVLDWLNEMIFLHVSFYLPMISVLLLFMALLIWFSALPLYLKSFSWVLILAAFAPFVQTPDLEKGEFRLRVLDVGQGLAVIIETREHRLLYDAGPAYGDYFDAGEFIVVPALKQSVRNFLQNNQLDMLMLSHGDNDHAGGAHSVLASMNVKQIVTSIGAFTTTGAVQCKAGEYWIWDGVEFEILAPFKDENLSVLSSNNQSCVLKVNGFDSSALLTGDIEATRELDLLEMYQQQLQSQILLAAHHGSKTSSSERFLETVNPELVLVSAAWKHHFGHPHISVTERFQARNIDWYNTAEAGEIVVLSSDLSQVRLARSSLRRFWR